MTVARKLARSLAGSLARGLTENPGTGAGVDNLLIDDNGDQLLIDDTNSDVLKIED